MREQRNSPTYRDTDTDASLYPQKTATSIRRYQQPNALVQSRLYPGQVFTGADGIEYIVMPGAPPVPTRASRGHPNTDTAPIPLPKQQAKGKVTIALLIGVVITLLTLWLIVTATNWWTGLQQDWTYTKAFRTYSIDQAVGHGGDSTTHPSHFIVQNDKGRILIVELPADDPKKATIMLGPILMGAEREPVTVTFQDTTGSGHLDLVLHCQGRQIVYINTGEKFVPPSE